MLLLVVVGASGCGVLAGVAAAFSIVACILASVAADFVDAVVDAKQVADCC